MDIDWELDLLQTHKMLRVVEYSVEVDEAMHERGKAACEVLNRHFMHKRIDEWRGNTEALDEMIRRLDDIIAHAGGERIKDPVRVFTRVSEGFKEIRAEAGSRSGA